MRRTLVALAASLLVWLAGSSSAQAQLLLKNDGFVDNQTVGFQGGFVEGEIGAARFVAPSAGRTLQSVSFLFGGGTGQRDITLRIYDDSGLGTVPGTEIFSADFQVTASNTAMQGIDLNGMNVVVPQTFRVGIELQHAGLPCIARDGDGSIAADKNYIFAGPGTWVRSQALGLTGDWIIRATVSDNGTAIDAGVDAPGSTIDAAPGGPDAGESSDCDGNGDCPVGSYCDTNIHSCTFDCRNDNDCGNDECNSLGQCVAAEGGTAGCCSTGAGGGVAGSLALGGAVALLLRRRRRR